MASPIEVLDFWLGQIGPEGWYAGTAEIDALCQDFLPVWQAAQSGGLDHWVEGTIGTLAYLILTDQLPRNLFRGQSDSFATDPQARAAARRALAEGWDMNAPEPDRQFFYMPFEHSEDLQDQDLAVSLMETRLASDPEMALHARAHRAIIARFGRFPSRNAALGRTNTPDEAAFLAEGGYAAMVAALRQGGGKE